MLQHEAGSHRGHYVCGKRAREALQSLAWRWARPPSVAPTLLGSSQECVICVLNRHEQRVRQLESTVSAQGAGSGHLTNLGS